jgi:hypothetical protein
MIEDVSKETTVRYQKVALTSVTRDGMSSARLDVSDPMLEPVHTQLKGTYCFEVKVGFPHCG